MIRYDEGIEPSRVQFIYYFSAVGIISTILFGVIPNISAGNRPLAIYEAILVIIATVNLIYFHKKRNYPLASRVILILMILVLSGLIITGGYKGTGIVWIYTFPLLSFFMKSYIHALLWNITFVVIVGFLLILEGSNLISVYYDTTTLRQAGGAYIAVTLLTFFYSYLINRLVRILRERAIKDPLTGLYNRDFVFENLEKVFERVKRGDESPYCIAYIDLDKFKHINDKYGHQEGDRILMEIARELSRNFRKGDILGRIGGDEFLALIYRCEPEMVEHRLKTIKERIMHNPDYRGISLSYGVVRMTGDDTSVDSLIMKADKKMYDMKRSSKK